MKEAKVMPVKKARVMEEPIPMKADDEVKKEEKKRKKRAPATRRKIGITNFPLGAKSKPYDLIEDVIMQGPNLTWPQLLHLSPRMQRQWSKMVSTRRSKSVSSIKAQVLQDILLVLDAHIKGQRVSKVYVDGGAQMCVISEKMMHRLGSEVSGPLAFKAKMANNVSVKCVGVVRNVKVTICGVQVGVDMYVLPAKGEGYPIILGRPWLMKMNVGQDWEIGTLLLKPPGGKGKSGQAIRYNMKEGKRESLELESTSKDEWSTEDSSSTAKASSSSESSDSVSSLEVMGIVLTEPKTKDGGSTKETLNDE